MEALFHRIVELLDQGGRAVLCTVVRTQGSTPRKAGARMLVGEDGRAVGTIGGGCVEARIFSEARRVLAERQPRLVRYGLSDETAAELGMICGGEMEVFVELVEGDPRLTLFGGGHISKALCTMAHGIGFRISVVDDRAEFASGERFPLAEQVVCADLAEAAARLPLGAAAYVVVATRGHEHDEAVLRALLGREIGYLGLLGSRGKAAVLAERLLAAGAPAERVRAIRIPVGLDLGAETPEQIALAIAAELLAVRRGRPGGFLCTLPADTPSAPSAGATAGASPRQAAAVLPGHPSGAPAAPAAGACAADGKTACR